VVINQTIQITSFTSTINPTFGSIVLYSLLILYGIMILVLVIAIRLPKVIRLPAEENSPEFETYLARLKKRLANNPYLKGLNLVLKNRADVETALKLLDSKADNIMKKTASSMFVSTAISQNGALDALLVLMGQMKMVWQITHLYNQRPSWAEIVDLYMNVIATTFAASQIEDLDISNQVEPMISSALGSSIAATVPGVSAVASILVSSTLNGAANAFLTLRVGIITKQYSASLTSPDKKSVIKSASLQAAARLGDIISQSTKEISKAAKEAVKKTGVYKGVTNATETVVDASKKASEIGTTTIKEASKRITEEIDADKAKEVIKDGTEALFSVFKKVTKQA